MPARNTVLKIFFVMLAALIVVFVMGSAISNPESEGIARSSGGLVGVLISLSAILSLGVLVFGFSIALSLFANSMREGSPMNYRKYFQKSPIGLLVWREHRETPLLKK